MKSLTAKELEPLSPAQLVALVLQQQEQIAQLEAENAGLRSRIADLDRPTIYRPSLEYLQPLGEPLLAGEPSPVAPVKEAWERPVIQGTMWTGKRP